MSLLEDKKQIAGMQALIKGVRHDLETLPNDALNALEASKTYSAPVRQAFLEGTRELASMLREAAEKIEMALKTASS